MSKSTLRQYRHVVVSAVVVSKLVTVGVVSAISGSSIGSWARAAGAEGTRAGAPSCRWLAPTGAGNPIGGRSDSHGLTGTIGDGGSTGLGFAHCSYRCKIRSAASCVMFGGIGGLGLLLADCVWLSVLGGEAKGGVVIKFGLGVGVLVVAGVTGHLGGGGFVVGKTPM